VVRIDEYIAMWERCGVFWFESRIGRECTNHAKFSSQFAAQFRRRMSMQLDASSAGNLGDLANFLRIGIDEHTDRAESARHFVGDLSHRPWLNVPCAFSVKVKPNHVCAESYARLRIVGIRYTADFDAYRIHD
jgi:hypothetical protein